MKIILSLILSIFTLIMLAGCGGGGGGASSSSGGGGGGGVSSSSGGGGGSTPASVAPVPSISGLSDTTVAPPAPSPGV